MKKNPLIYFVSGAVISAVLLVVVTRERWQGAMAAVETSSSSSQTASNAGTSQTGSQPVAEQPPAKEQQQAAVEPKAKLEKQTEAAAQADTETSVAPKTPAKPAAKPSVEPEQAKESVTPSFDIVRVEEDGGAVIAGRAEPGSEVMLTLDGDTVGEAVANDRGEWVVTPMQPLPKGAHNLMIVSKNAAGEVKQSDQVVAVAVPETGDEQPLIVLTKPSEPSKVLQKPEPAATAQSQTEQAVAAVDPSAETAKSEPAPAAKAAPAESATEPTPQPAPLTKTPLSLETVDYNDAGDIIFSGKTDAGATVRIYVDNQHVGDALADSSGQWLFRGNEKISSGLHLLRIDRVQSNGKVVQRRELPFERADPAKVAELQAAQSAGTASATQTPTTGQTSSQSSKTEPAAETEPATQSQTAAKSEPPTQTEQAVASEPASQVEQAAKSEPVAKTEKAKKIEPSVETTSVEPAPSVPSPSDANQSSETQTAAVATTQQTGTSAQAAADTSNVAENETQTAAITPERKNEQSVVPRIGRVVIQPGNNLWNISRVIYGSGIQYSVIYEANKDQIRNPDLIYPGQIFSTPGAAPPEEIDPKRREPLANIDSSTQ